MITTLLFALNSVLLVVCIVKLFKVSADTSYRILLRRHHSPGVIPTIADENKPIEEWEFTDIHEAELFYNIPDKALYTRSGNEIVKLNN